MRLDAELSSKMEANLVTRNNSGPNADPPVSQRIVPRVTSVLMCAREGYYTLIGTDKLPMDPTSAGAAQAGQALEADVLTDLLRALEVVNLPGEFEMQVRVTTDCYTGSADLYIPRLSLVADAKTTNASAFDIIAKEGKAKPEHVMQLAAYGIPLGAKEGIIVYRGTGNTKKVNGGRLYMVFRFPLTPDMVKPLEVNARAALAGRETNTPPPRAFPQSHWKCSGYCAYRNTCWGGGQ